MAEDEHPSPRGIQAGIPQGNFQHSTLNKSESLKSHDFGGCEVSGMVSKIETTWVILCGGADVGGFKARMAEVRGHAETLELRKQKAET